jgi:autophagy-related protein 5
LRSPYFSEAPYYYCRKFSGSILVSRVVIILGRAKFLLLVAFVFFDSEATLLHLLATSMAPPRPAESGDSSPARTDDQEASTTLPEDNNEDRVPVEDGDQISEGKAEDADAEAEAEADPDAVEDASEEDEATPEEVPEGNADADPPLASQVWAGAFPLVIGLDSDEVTTLDSPPPLYILAPRCGYLAFLVAESQLLDHLLPHADVNAAPSNLWLSSSESVSQPDGSPAPSESFGARRDRPVPVRWHIPTGVLWDAMRVAAQLRDTDQNDEFSLFGPSSALVAGAEVAPWELEAHFQQFPSEVVMRMIPDDHDGTTSSHLVSVRTHFFNSLKEASYIKHGDSHAVNSLSVSESDAIWNAMCAQDWKSFTGAARGKLDAEAGRLHRVPLRVFLDGSVAKCYQEPVVPYDANGEVRLLGDVLQEVLRLHDPEATPAEPEMVAIIHGVQVPLDTPIVWIVVNMCHPDQFVYVVVARKPKT